MPSSKVMLVPLPSLGVSKHFIPAHDRLPNSSIQNKPLLIYHTALSRAHAARDDESSGSSSNPGTERGRGLGRGQAEGEDEDETSAGTAAADDPHPLPASAVEAHLAAVGVVTPQWRYSMYPTTHFHSTTHEVLCVTSGRARLCFGGDANPGRVEPTVQVGDVMVVPAGVAHRLLEDLGGGSSGGFEMVGSYPVGSRHWDMCYGKAGEEAKVRSIERLEWFRKDPVYGEHGPVLEV